MEKKVKVIPGTGKIGDVIRSLERFKGWRNVSICNPVFKSVVEIDSSGKSTKRIKGISIKSGEDWIHKLREIDSKVKERLKIGEEHLNNYDFWIYMYD